MKKLNLGIIIFLVFFAMVSLIANSKKVGAITVNEKAIQEQQKQMEESCFHKYQLGNENISVIIENKSDAGFAVGQKVELVFPAQNFSQTVIPNGSVFVQVEKVNSMQITPKFGDIQNYNNKIVQEFFVGEEVFLDKGETKIIKYSWELPENIETGTYRINAYLLRGKNINIGFFRKDALESALEANGYNGTHIFIKGNQEGEIALNQKTKLNDVDYDGMGLDVINENVKIQQSILNSFMTDKKITITKKLYQGNYLAEENLIEEQKEEATIKTKTAQQILTEISKDKIDFNSPFPYYLRTIISYDGIDSIYETVPLFNKKNSTITASYIPFINKFPIKKGEEFEVVACANNAKNENLVMNIVLKDKNGKIVETMKKDLSAGMDMLSAAKTFKFIAKEDYAWLSVEANISKGEKQVDKYSVSYSAGTESIPVEKNKNFKWIIVIASALLVMILAIWFLLKKIKNNKSGMSNGISNGMSGGMMGLLFLFFGVSFFALPNLTYAATESFDITQGALNMAIDGSAAIGFNCGPPVGIGAAMGSTNYTLVLDGAFSGTPSTGIKMVGGQRINLYFKNGTDYKKLFSPWFDDMTFSFVAKGTDGQQYSVGSGNGNTNFPFLIDMGAYGVSGFGGGVGAVGIFTRPHYINTYNEGVFQDGCSGIMCVFPTWNDFITEIKTKVKQSLGAAKISDIYDPQNIISCDISGAGCNTTGNSGTATLQVSLPAKSNYLGMLALSAFGTCVAKGQIMWGGGLSSPNLTTNITLTVDPPPNPPCTVDCSCKSSIELIGGNCIDSLSVEVQRTWWGGQMYETVPLSRYFADIPWYEAKAVPDATGHGPNGYAPFYFNVNGSYSGISWSGSTTGEVFPNSAYCGDHIHAYISCPPYCGDGVCNGGETCSTCPIDCGYCSPCSAGITTNPIYISIGDSTNLTWSSDVGVWDPSGNWFTGCWGTRTKRTGEVQSFDGLYPADPLGVPTYANCDSTSDKKGCPVPISNPSFTSGSLTDSYLFKISCWKPGIINNCEATANVYVCGNNVIEGNEECDGTSLGSCLTCYPPGNANECKCASVPTVCGNGILENPPEACEPTLGGCSAGKKCSNTCQCEACPCVQVSDCNGLIDCGRTKTKKCIGGEGCNCVGQCIPVENEYCGDCVDNGDWREEAPNQQ